MFEKNVTLEDGSDLPQSMVRPTQWTLPMRLNTSNWKIRFTRQLYFGDISLVESFELAALMRLSPFMVHSATEGSPTALFHAQMLADFHTIEELGERLLAELSADGIEF